MKIVLQTNYTLSLLICLPYLYIAPSGYVLIITVPRNSWHISCILHYSFALINYSILLVNYLKHFNGTHLQSLHPPTDIHTIFTNILAVKNFPIVCEQYNIFIFRIFSNILPIFRFCF